MTRHSRISSDSIQDHRSAVGLKNGTSGEAYLSSDDLASLHHFVEEANEGKAIAARTQAALEACMRHLMYKHKLSGKDSINLVTGKISKVES